MFAQGLTVLPRFLLSIVMTVFSTVLALGMMPLLLYLYCQGFPSVQKAVPFTKIMISLAMLLIPCSIGIAINHYWPKYSKYITRVGANTQGSDGSIKSLWSRNNTDSCFLKIKKKNLTSSSSDD